MRVVVLTTDTLHHTFFVESLRKASFEVTVCCEDSVRHPPKFECGHPYEIAREEHERDRWFNGEVVTLDEMTDVHHCDDVNSHRTIAAIESAKADCIIVFGTGIIRRPLISLVEDRIFNLHGGPPEEYRGLDSHLWAIYHRDFTNLKTTLHRVAPDLDTGDVIIQSDLEIVANMSLAELRAVNTEVCLKLTLSVLSMLKGDSLVSHKQVKQGRYYSYMPSVLKEVACRRFEHFTKGHYENSR